MKGVTVLSFLKEFNYIEDTVIDSMHALFLHIVLIMLDLWFSKTYQVHLFDCYNY